MKRILGTFISALWLIAVASLAVAQGQTSAKYIQVPGVREFSGELIVRPLQPDELSRRGLGPQARRLHAARARQVLSPNAREYVAQTDEYIVRVPFFEDENSFSQKLMRTGLYQYAHPNWRLYPARNPNDPLFGQQWHHARVKSPQAWDLVTGSNAVICAFVDTGIDVTHPDLAPNRVPGYNSADRVAEVDGGIVTDINGHGTHVAGCGAAIGNNARGVAGMGWNFKIMMIKASNDPSGGAFLDDLLDGARWAVDHGARSISVSYSGVDNDAVGTTGTYVKSQGGLLMWAAGNDNRNLNGFFHPDTIVVGATDSGDNKASFSAYGPAVQVFAPGVNILSTTLGGSYGFSSGTSMAAPIVNGAVAMIWAANPALTPNEVQTILYESCDAIGPSIIFGNGRINQFKNVTRAIEEIVTPIDLAPSSITTAFGTWVSGTLSDILNPNTGGPTYDVDSAPSRPVAGVELVYQTPFNPDDLISLSLTFQAKRTGSQVTTAFIYLWDYNAGAYVHLASLTLGSSLVTKTIPLSTTDLRFIGPGGEMKTLFRVIPNVAGGRFVPMPFQLNFAHSRLTFAAHP